MTSSKISFIVFLFLISIKANAVDDVNTQPLSELIIHQNYQYPARVIALNKITLSSEITGVISSKTFLVGSPVKKNQHLIRLNCTDNELAKDQAVAALKRLKVQKKLAQQQLTRARKLVRVKSISKQELDQKQTALDADTASLEQQRVALKIIDHNISKCIIKAPFEGIITQTNAHKGIYVTPGMPLITLIEPSAIEIEVKLPLDISHQLSDPLSHSLNNSTKPIKNIIFTQNKQSYPVSIRTVLPLVDEASKQNIIRLSFNGLDLPLANSLGSLQWTGQQALLPSQYVVQRKGQLGFFAAESGMAIFKPLTRAIEGQNTPIYTSSKTLVITNKLLILNNNDIIE